MLPGEYSVRAVAAGYVTQTRTPVAVAPGDDVFAGVLELAHQAESGEAVTLVGVVVLDDGADPSGTEVRVRLADFGLAKGAPEQQANAAPLTHLSDAGRLRGTRERARALSTGATCSGAQCSLRSEPGELDPGHTILNHHLIIIISCRPARG